MFAYQMSSFNQDDEEMIMLRCTLKPSMEGIFLVACDHNWGNVTSWQRTFLNFPPVHNLLLWLVSLVLDWILFLSGTQLCINLSHHTCLPNSDQWLLKLTTLLQHTVKFHMRDSSYPNHQARPLDQLLVLDSFHDSSLWPSLPSSAGLSSLVLSQTTTWNDQHSSPEAKSKKAVSHPSLRQACGSAVLGWREKLGKADREKKAEKPNLANLLNSYF